MQACPYMHSHRDNGNSNILATLSNGSFAT